MYCWNDPQPSESRHVILCLYWPFHAGDNKQLFLVIQNEREWKSFCEIVLQSPKVSIDYRFNSNAKRSDNSDELREIILSIFKLYNASEIIERLEEAQIANASLNSVLDFVNHHKLKARNRWREVMTEKGAIKALIPPVTMEGFEPVMNPIPKVGEHTQAILDEFKIEKIK